MPKDYEIPRVSYAEDDDEDDSKQTVLRDLLAFRPPTRRRPCLIVVGGNRSVGKIFRLREGSMTIGRSVACDVVLEEEGVSRHHATVRVEPNGAVIIEDAGSSNGLVYSGVKVKAQALRDGDRLEIGDAGVALLHMDDIDETLRQNLLESATEDDETRLATRRHFKVQLSRECVLADRYQTPLSVILVGIDSFKHLIDGHGRATGVNMLKKCARIARDLVSREDVTIARYGEDQLALLMPETAEDDARTSAEVLRKAIAAGTASSKSPVPPLVLTVSLGAATTGPELATADELLNQAERGLYRAKVAGGNQLGARG